MELLDRGGFLTTGVVELVEGTKHFVQGVEKDVTNRCASGCRPLRQTDEIIHKHFEFSKRPGLVVCIGCRRWQGNCRKGSTWGQGRRLDFRNTFGDRV
jgi:hypothetical protein